MMNMPPSVVSRPGLPASYHVENRHATACVCRQGAQVMRYQPRGAGPLLWAADESHWAGGKPLRGGVPVCWPWFGPHRADAALPQHGWARQSEWTLSAAEDLPDGSTRMAFDLAAEKPRTDFPRSLVARLEITVGPVLTLALTSRNLGEEPVRLTNALHTYFRVGDVRRISISPLAGLAYYDLLDGCREKTEPADPDGLAPPVTRVYRDAPPEMVIADPVLRRRIRIRAGGCRSAVLWSPGAETAAKMTDLGDAWTSMVCLESGNCHDAALVLPPGGTQVARVEYSLLAL